MAPGYFDSDPSHPPYPATFINFDTSLPELNYVPCPFFGETMNLTMSDHNGNFLFYSNGYSIFHLDGTLMNNDSGITEDTFPSWYPFSPPMFMAMMGLPRPGHDNDYYMLHLEGGPTFYDRRRLILTLLTDVTGPQSGSVAYKNKPLFEEGHWLEFFHATRHANGRDWWVVISDADSVAQERTFYTFFLGVDTAYLAHTQWFEEYGPIPPVWQNWTWQRVFTPDGRYLITLDLDNGVRIHPYNRCTGELGPLMTLSYQRSGLGGVAVSPNSRFLYVNTEREVMQYDLSAGDIAATRDTVAVYDGFIDTVIVGAPTYFFFPTLGPDGKIYFLDNTVYLHYIAKPNKQGAACQVVQRGLRTPTYNLGPPYFPNYRLGPLDNSPCDTLGLNNEPLADFWWFADSTLTVEFADNSSYEPAAWHWDFGDGGTSQDTSPVHVFPAQGDYLVCLTVSNTYAADTVCKVVTLTGGASGAQAAEAVPECRLLVAPNPADDRVRVHWPGVVCTSGARLELWDALGIRRRSVPADGPRRSAELSTTDLPAGLYVCRLLDKGRVVAATKFLVGISPP